MTVYYAPTSQIETVDFSLDAGVTILDYFSTLFEVSYPQPNLGILFYLKGDGWVDCRSLRPIALLIIIVLFKLKFHQRFYSKNGSKY